jgi:type VI secretion system protein ImpC
MAGVVVWQHNLSHTLNQAIQQIEELLSLQLAEIIHHQDFLDLEARWLAIQQLSERYSSSSQIKIKIMQLTKEELSHDLCSSSTIDTSELHNKLYQQEFGSSGGQPYGALIGDYEFSHQQQDPLVLSKMAQLAALSFCPFLSSASANLLGLQSWQELNKPRSLAPLVDGPDYIQWQQLRDMDEARFIYLCLPRVLARAPYQSNDHHSSFNFNEASQQWTHYSWMNAAYSLAGLLANAFIQYGWCTHIRGVEGGGKVSELPTTSINHQPQLASPTETTITDSREAELSQLGLLPLCHYKHTNFAVFFGAESLQKAKVYDSTRASENSKISARLPYIMATSRFAHYLKMMGRDKIGSFISASDAEDWLNRWILNYVNGNNNSNSELKAKYPLREAKITVVESAGNPGTYQATAWLCPWLQMEELTTSMRLVAELPKFN